MLRVFLDPAGTFLLVVLFSVHYKTHNVRIVDSACVGLRIYSRDVWVNATLEQAASAYDNLVGSSCSVLLQQEEVLVHEGLIV